MLINCPECGQQVSDTAPACPHCGYQLRGASTAPPVADAGASQTVQHTSEVMRRTPLGEVNRPTTSRFFALILAVVAVFFLFKNAIVSLVLIVVALVILAVCHSYRLCECPYCHTKGSVTTNSTVYHCSSCGKTSRVDGDDLVTIET